MLFKLKNELQKIRNESVPEGKLWADEVNASLSLIDRFVIDTNIINKLRDMIVVNGVIPSTITQDPDIVITLDKPLDVKPKERVTMVISVDTQLPNDGKGLTITHGNVFIDAGFGIYPLMSKGMQMNSSSIELFRINIIEYNHTSDSFESHIYRKRLTPIPLDTLETKSKTSNLIMKDYSSLTIREIETSLLYDTGTDRSLLLELKDLDKSVDRSLKFTIYVSIEDEYDNFPKLNVSGEYTITIDIISGKIHVDVNPIHEDNVSRDSEDTNIIIGLQRYKTGDRDIIGIVFDARQLDNSTFISHKSKSITLGDNHNLSEADEAVIQAGSKTSSINLSNLKRFNSSNQKLVFGDCEIFSINTHKIYETANIYPSLKHISLENQLKTGKDESIYNFVLLDNGTFLTYRKIDGKHEVITRNNTEQYEGTMYEVSAYMASSDMDEIVGGPGGEYDTVKKVRDKYNIDLHNILVLLSSGVDSLTNNGGDLTIRHEGGSPTENSKALTLGYVKDNVVFISDIIYPEGSYEKYVNDNYSSNLGAIDKPEPILEEDISKLCLLHSHITEDAIVQNLNKMDDKGIQFIYDSRGIFYTKKYTLDGFNNKSYTETKIHNGDIITYVADIATSTIPNNFIDVYKGRAITNSSVKTVTQLDNTKPSIIIGDRGSNYLKINNRVLSGKVVEDESLACSGELINIDRDFNIMMRVLAVTNSNSSFKLSSNANNSVYINLNTNTLYGYGNDENGLLGSDDTTTTMSIIPKELIDTLNPMSIVGITDGDSRIYESIDNTFTYVDNEHNVVNDDVAMEDAQRVWGGSNNYIISKNNGDIYLSNTEGGRNIGVTDGKITHVPIDGWVEDIIDDGFTTSIKTETDDYFLGEVFNGNALGDTEVNINNEIHTFTKNLDCVSNVETVGTQGGVVYRNNGFVYYDHNNNSVMVLKGEDVEGPETQTVLESLIGSSYVGVLIANNRSALWVCSKDNIYKGLDDSKDKHICGVKTDKSIYLKELSDILIDSNRSHKLT